MSKSDHQFPSALASPPPHWSLHRPKGLLQSAYDLALAPLRMVVLPDHVSERLHTTSLRAERFAAVLPEMRGRCLDIGAGDNMLVSLYRSHAARLGVDQTDADESVGVDVVDWGCGCTIVPSSDKLPFEDASFDTVCYIACINHIPERREALIEASRVLRPGGRVVITMIGRFIGTIGHAIWWYSEDKHRDIDEEEEMGMDRKEILSLLKQTGYSNVQVKPFFYGLNTLFIAQAD